MISMRSATPLSLKNKSSTAFKYVDKGYKNSIVLIPGWASDYRIFETLDLRFNYLIPVEFSPFTFGKNLLAFLKENNIEKISLFGHSMGGFAATEFASKYKDFVDELILVSVRKKYKAFGLGETRKHLKKSKRGYLYKFYSQCFSKKEEMRWFRENLLKTYCKELTLDYLLKTLDYLENAEIKPDTLSEVKKITIIHGRGDQIAPIQEAIEIKERLPHARFICIEDAGHIPWGKNRDSDYFLIKMVAEKNSRCPYF